MSVLIGADRSASLDGKLLVVERTDGNVDCGENETSVVVKNDRLVVGRNVEGALNGVL